MGKQARPKSRSRHSMASALYSSTQLRVLAMLFGQPERSFFLSEVIERARAGSGAVQRELSKLSESGLVTVSRVGKQKHYQANPRSPIFGELCAIVRKTVGLVEPLQDALGPLEGEIELALVYGSVAKGTDTAYSDIDLLLVSDSLTLESVYAALSRVEPDLGRPIRPTLYTSAELEQRLRNDAFVRRVVSGDAIVLMGSVPDVETGARCLEHTVGLPSAEWRVLDEAHRKRNRAEYEGDLDVNLALVEAVERVAHLICERVAALGPIRIE